MDQSAFENALSRRRCLVLHEIAIYERLSYRTNIAIWKELRETPGQAIE